MKAPSTWPALDLTLQPACACGHRDNQHDAVAARYCAATASAALDRGCICHPETDTARRR